MLGATSIFTGLFGGALANSFYDHFWRGIPQPFFSPMDEETASKFTKQCIEDHSRRLSQEKERLLAKERDADQYRRYHNQNESSYSNYARSRGIVYSARYA
jgi:hypothetical protein